MQIIYAIISILIAQSAGAIGSIFTIKSVKTWYKTLKKPSWNPPNWVFGPVWTILYTLMGIASYLVWHQIDTPKAKLALYIYAIHLVLNALWSFLFFGAKKLGLAFAEILVLLASIITTIVLFWQVTPLAGALMIPYLCWVSFASVLNYTVWRLNIKKT